MNDPPRGYVDDDRGTANTIAVVFTVAIMTTSAIIAGAALTSDVQQDASTGAQVEQATVTAQTGDKLRITPEIGNQLPLDGITVKVTLESGRTVTISDVSQALALSQQGAPQRVQVAQSESDDDDDVGVEQSDDGDESVAVTADVPVYRWEKDVRIPVYTWEKTEAQEVPKYQWSKQYTTEEPVYKWEREVTRTKSKVARSNPGIGSLSTYAGTGSDWSRAGVDHTEQKQVGTEQVLDHYETERYLSHFTRTRERVQTGYTYSYERVQTGYSYSYERVQTGYRYERNCRTVGGWYGYGGVTRCSTDRVPTYDYQRTREPTYDIRRTREPTYDYRYTREPVYDTRRKPVYREEPVYETVRYYTWEKEVTTTRTETAKSAPGSGWERAGIDHYDTVTKTKYQTAAQQPGLEWQKVKQVGTVTEQTQKTTVSRTRPGSEWERAGVDHYWTGSKTTESATRPGPEWTRGEQVETRTSQMEFADTDDERGGSAPAQDGDRDDSDGTTVTVEGYEFAADGNANALNNADESGIVNGLSNAFGLSDDDNPGLGVRVDGDDDAAVEQTVSGVGGDVGSTQARSWATGESFVVDLENDVLDTGDVVRVQVINDQSNELLLDKQTRLTNPYLSTGAQNTVNRSPNNPPNASPPTQGQPETTPDAPGQSETTPAPSENNGPNFEDVGPSPPAAPTSPDNDPSGSSPSNGGITPNDPDPSSTPTSPSDGEEIVSVEKSNKDLKVYQKEYNGRWYAETESGKAVDLSEYTHAQLERRFDEVEYQEALDTGRDAYGTGEDTGRMTDDPCAEYGPSPAWCSTSGVQASSGGIETTNNDYDEDGRNEVKDLKEHDTNNDGKVTVESQGYKMTLETDLHNQGGTQATNDGSDSSNSYGGDSSTNENTGTNANNNNQAGTTNNDHDNDGYNETKRAAANDANNDGKVEMDGVDWEVETDFHNQGNV